MFNIILINNKLIKYKHKETDDYKLVHGHYGDDGGFVRGDNSESKREIANDIVDIEEEYMSELAKELEESTEEEVLHFIKISDEVLKRLKEGIESEETNPEKRFETSGTFRV